MNNFVKIATIGAVAVAVAAPSLSDAQTRSQLQRRQQQKNQWRNIAYGAGALGIFGAIKKDRNLTILGAAGAAYAAHRYEQDRKSQRRLEDSARWRSSNRYNSGLRYTTRRGQRVWDGPGKNGRGKAKGHYKNGKRDW